MKDIDLVKHAKHIIENGGLLARDTAMALIEQLESVQRERDELKEQVKTLNSRLAACKSVNESFKDRAWAAEEELQRRNAAAGEPVAYLHIDREGFIEANGHNAFSNGAQGFPVYTAAQPAVLPQSLSDAIVRLTGEAQHINYYCHHIDEHSCVVNRRDLITLTDAARALGCQPEKVVKIDNIFSISVAGVGVKVALLSDVSKSLDAAGVKWEVTGEKSD